MRGTGSSTTTTPVALRKESVDRNTRSHTFFTLAKKSLSARRAWIEIDEVTEVVKAECKSLSARRAWIEIPPYTSSMLPSIRRSPQGERG